nr:hypothetical protein [Tanacetum cinerariifolium]
MVACLEKTKENVEFHQIVDFLSTCSLNYALTMSLSTARFSLYCWMKLCTASIIVNAAELSERSFHEFSNEIDD